VNGSDDPLQALTGDHAGAVLLRRSLTALADAEAGSALGYRVREVLAGDRDVRSLADDPDFVELTRRGMEAFTAEWEGLSPQQRSEQLRAGQELLAALDDRTAVDP
jgi:hypothetical protein